jgi:hypothetical protein
MKLAIYIDPSPSNPRHECEKDTIMACTHKRYNLGDVQFTDPIDWLERTLNVRPRGEYNNVRLYDLELKFLNKFVAKKLYLYDHSGITISTSPFSCPWDSGQVGYIYMTKKKAISIWGRRNYKAKALELIEAEVKEYDQYLRGDVYGYSFIDDDNNLDGCWGFLGTDWAKNGLKDSLPEEAHHLLENIQIFSTPD